MNLASFAIGHASTATSNQSKTMNANRRHFLSQVFTGSAGVAAGLALSSNNAFADPWKPNLNNCNYISGYILGRLTDLGNEAQNAAAFYLGTVFTAGNLGTDCTSSVTNLISNLDTLYPPVANAQWDEYRNQLLAACCLQT